MDLEQQDCAANGVYDKKRVIDSTEKQSLYNLSWSMDLCMGGLDEDILSAWLKSFRATCKEYIWGLPLSLSITNNFIKFYIRNVNKRSEFKHKV